MLHSSWINLSPMYFNFNLTFIFGSDSASICIHYLANVYISWHCTLAVTFMGWVKWAFSWFQQYVMKFYCFEWSLLYICYVPMLNKWMSWQSLWIVCFKYWISSSLQKNIFFLLLLHNGNLWQIKSGFHLWPRLGPLSLLPKLRWKHQHTVTGGISIGSLLNGKSTLEFH